MRMRSGAMRTGPSRRAIRATCSSCAKVCAEAFIVRGSRAQSRDQRFAHPHYPPAATLIRIQTAEVNAVKRLLRGVGLNRGPAAACARMLTGSALLAGDVVPEELKEHVRHQYAVRSQAAERVRALDLSLGESACGRR